MKAAALLALLTFVIAGWATPFIQDSKPVKPDGKEVSTKGGEITLKMPKGWFKIDPKDKDYQAMLKKLGNPPEMKKVEETAADGLDLMVMDLETPTTVFRRNMNVIGSEGAINDAKTLDLVFDAIQAEMPKTKLQHKLMRFPVSRALCYWGPNPETDELKTDLIGYVVSTLDKSYVFTFCCTGGELEKFRPICDGIMQTVTAK